MGWLRGWLSGGGDELGWDDLVDRITAAIAARRQFGRRGQAAFPARLQVTVIAPPDGLEVIRGFVSDPELARRVEAELVNRCDCERAALPLCGYAVVEGERFEVQLDELAAIAAWEIEISGGDRAGQRLEVPDRPELRFGRGQWHGRDAQLANDLIVSDRDPFVSRRAGRLFRVGHGLEVEALDQADFLTVHRAGGGQVRPARCASGRVTLSSGDRIELSSGDGESVELVLRRSGAS